MKFPTTLQGCLLLSCLLPLGATHAIGQGDWLLRFGGAQVSPNDASRGVVADDAIDVDANAQPFVNLTYMLRDNIGLEVLGALPFKHDITLNGSKIAETKQLPPTISVQYHFLPKDSIRPYVGAGLNYTTFFSEKATATITSISLDDSTGLAVQAGVDGDINKNWFWNADLRYINIETTAATNLGNIEVDINPWVFSLGVGTRF
ncbi:MAG: OmpW family outer membrane protein [Gammaproteobacteria bacterium]